MIFPLRWKSLQILGGYPTSALGIPAVCKNLQRTVGVKAVLQVFGKIHMKNRGKVVLRGQAIYQITTNVSQCNDWIVKNIDVSRKNKKHAT